MSVKNETIHKLYKGKRLLATGTVDEIAEKMGTVRSTIMFYQTKSYKQRRNKSGGKYFRRLIPEDADIQDYL